jgi:hypothetical protein
MISHDVMYMMCVRERGWTGGGAGGESWKAVDYCCSCYCYKKGTMRMRCYSCWCSLRFGSVCWVVLCQLSEIDNGWSCWCCGWPDGL